MSPLRYAGCVESPQTVGSRAVRRGEVAGLGESGSPPRGRVAGAVRMGGSPRSTRNAGGTGMTWPPELPFAHVLATARALDPSAVAQLYRRFLPVVYRYSLARVGDVHAAEDVTSETFIAM